MQTLPLYPRSDSLRESQYCELHGLVVGNETYDDMYADNCTWRNVGIRHCQFTKCDLSGVVFSACRTAETKFTRCRFSRTGLGYDGSRYVNCEFHRCDFRQAFFIRAEFDNCLFASCNFNRVNFNASSFENVRFTGEVSRAWFRGGYGYPGDEETFGKPRPNRMLNVDFREATLKFCTFTHHCDLSTVLLPERQRIRLLKDWNRRLEQLERLSRHWDEPNRTEALTCVEIFSVHAAQQDQMLLCYSDLENWWPASAERIWDILCLDLEPPSVP